MTLTKRQFCVRNNIEPQAFTRFVELGLISANISQRNGCVRITVEPEEINKLVEGQHYVSCSSCGRKAFVLSKKHHKICNGGTVSYSASALYTGEKAKTDEQKKAQSEKLKDRFKTDEGGITRRQISEASKQYNSLESVREYKSVFFTDLCKDEKRREASRTRTTKMWTDPAHIQKMAEYVQSHRDVLARSAAHARKFNSSTSLLHLGFKKSMVEYGIQGFESEQDEGFYRVDELNRGLKIALEIDGCYWHGCEKCGFEGIPGIRRIDKSKETFLTRNGWFVVRVQEHDIRKNLKGCLDRVAGIVKERACGHN